jgi:hypothetical protein
MTNLYALGTVGLSRILGRGGICLLFVGLAITQARAQLVIRLEQASNGTPEAPVSAVEWVNSRLTAERAHYVEHSSLPYRLVFEALVPGAHRVVIGWDTKTSGRHAMDYLTHYNRLLPHNQFGAHNVPETIQPLRNVSGGLDGPLTFPIPSPGLPESSFRGLPANQRMFHIYNGTITSAMYVAEDSLASDVAESRIAIDFVANQSPVMILFGGHLAAKAEWGAGQTAAGESGGEYRMRLVELDGLPSLLNVTADGTAVVGPPICDVAGPDPVCPGTTNTYTATTDVTGPSFTWMLTENTAGASIAGPNNGPVVQVRSGTGGGRYVLQVAITQGPLQSACSQNVTVLTNVTTTPLANTAVCPGGTAKFSTQPAGTGPFTFVWRKGSRVLDGETNNILVLSNLLAKDSGIYCVEVTGACNRTTNCAMLTVHASTAATALPELSRCAGDSATFATTPSGTGPFSYRWRKNGAEIPGQTNRIYSIPNVTMADAGAYSVEVTGLCNTATNFGRLVVHALPICGIQGPSTVCPDSSGTVYFAPPGMTAYRWRVTGNGAVVGPTNEQAVVLSSTGPGFLTLYLGVVNSNGCARTCSRTITVGDIQPPLVVCPENLETNTEPGKCSRVVEFAVSASDNCDEPSVMCHPPSGAQFPKGTTTVNCTAVDGAGNQGACSFNVRVLDLEKPVLSWPTNLVVNTAPGMCEAPVGYEVSVMDNCPGTSLICSPPSGTVFPLGTSSVNCRGSDAAGNVEFCTFDVTMIDNEGPQITCSPDLAFTTDPGQCDVVVTYGVQAIDNCAMAQIVCVPPSGSLLSRGTTTVICLASDVSLNQSRCSFQVQVDDGENPRVACPGDINVTAEPERCDALVNFTYKASDNCREVNVMCTPASGSRFALGQTHVTCTATDISGNTASCTFKVTVTDNQRPVLTCPQNVVTNTQPGRCDAVVLYMAAVADNCPGATLECVPPSESVFSAGLTVVNCSAADASGNLVSCAFNVMVQDVELPAIPCPGNIITDAAPGECFAFVSYNLSTMDNCPGAELFCAPDSGGPFEVGETAVYCVAVDTSGNAQECVFSVIVRDVERPVISCPADLTVNMATGRCDAVVTFAVTATDNCSALPVTCTPPSGSVFPKGTNTVNCTAQDPTGNSAACAFRVVVQDEEPPALNCPASIVLSTESGQCDAAVSFITTISDNCGGPSVICTPPSGARFALGLTTVNCVATDTSGNTNRCSFFVSISDDEVPAITCPANIVIATEFGRCDARVTFSATASDNCAVAAIACVPPSGSRFSKGTTDVVCTARDSSGNEESCAFSVTVNDTEPPAITCPTTLVVAAESEQCDAAVSFAPSFSDNCAGATIVCSPPSGSRFVVGQTPVTCVAADASGNTNRCSFMVVVQDLEPPELVCPDDIVTAMEAGQCDAAVVFSPTVADNCPGVVAQCVPPPGSRFPQGQTTVTCTANDASGNSVACGFTVTVNDNQPPALTCPSNIVANTAPGRCDAVVSYAPTVTDNCSGAMVSCTPPSGATFGLGITPVDCVATDVSGNTNRCSFVVTIEDLEKPAIVCPEPQELFTEAGRCDAVATFETSATDNCADVSITCVPSSGSRFAKGVNTVVCTARDGSGNTESCAFGVTVRDIAPPVLTCPGDIVASAEAARCDAIINFAATVQDDCPGATVMCMPPSGTRFSKGTTPVNCTALDDSSNRVTCSFSVTVDDREAPRLVCSGDILTKTAAGRCDAVVEFAPMLTDNCTGAEVLCEPPGGSTFPLGTNIVVCAATDTSGNQDNCAFSVVVLDLERPVVICPGNITINTEPGRCDAAVTFVASATDNCSQAAVVCNPPSGTRFSQGVTSVTCTATDASANTASCSFTVRVNDNEPPLVTCPQDIVVNAEAGLCSARAIFSPQVSDNCPGAFVACLPAPGAEFLVGTTRVICAGTDGAGNTGLCAFDVRVIDAEPPQLICPGDLIVNTDPTQCVAKVSYTFSATDACSVTNLICTPASGSVFPKGVTLVSCNARDASGNEAACAFNVTVRDSEVPALVCPADIVAAASTGRCDAAVDFAPTFSDNCPGLSVLCAPPSGTTFALGTTTVTCTATDLAGNTNQCRFSVRVIDTERPIVTCSSNLVVSCDSNRCDTIVSFATSVTDNCGAMNVSCTPPSGSRFGLGTNIVNCSGIDAAGNVGTCSFTVTVGDTQPPVVQCPGNLLAPTAAGRCDATVNFNVSATDNCGTPSGFCMPPSGSAFPVGTTTVNCTISDASLNSANCQFTVTVRDTEAPTVQCPADLLVNTGTARCDAVATFTPQASDNCSGVNVTCSPPSGTTFLKGTNLVTCTARDASSNSVDCVFKVIVRDVEKPQTTCPGNMVVSTAGNECRARVTYAASATDNCGGVTVACSPPSNSYFNKGTNTVSCVATDASGNTNACAFTVTVNDTIAPNITCPANILTNANRGQGSAVVQFAPAVSDNCPGASYVCAPPSGSSFQQGTTTVTCTATDTSGNTRACSFLVIVNDTEPPVINCPTNQIVATAIGRCDAVCNYTVTASDNSQMVTIVCTPPSGSVFPKGLTDVLCKASDPASNTVSCGFTITVVDLENPVYACPTNMVVNTDRGRCDARVTYSTNVTDNCPGASVTCNPPSGTVFPKGTNIIACTARDTSGNTQTCAFSVQVVDNEKPLVGCSANLFFDAPAGQCDLPVSYNASVVDNCPGGTVSCSPASGSTFTIGATIVTCTARDTSGNTSSCTFLVEVRDQQRPVITCPTDMTTFSYPTACSAPVSYPVTVQDNCPGATISCTPPSGSAMPVGTNWVACSAADTSGNTAACSFRVVVRDIERPALTCPADIVIDGSNGNCSRVATYNPSVRDNCPGVTVACVPPSGTTFAEGTNRVQCTAVDANANMTMCTFSVIVRLQPLTAAPLESQVRCAGETATFTMSVAGAGAAFAWLKNGVIVAGQTNASLTLSNLTTVDAGLYTVMATNACSGITNSATLQVNTPVVINGMTNVTRCDCDPLVLSPVVSGTGPLSYVWRKNGSVLTGANSNILAFAKLAATDAGVYSVEVSGACNTAVASANVTVITVPNPAVYTNSGAIRMNDLAAAFPYPSSVRVQCVPRPVQRATVTLRGFSHNYPDDVDMMLVAPDGESVMLMSDAGDGSFANNVNITLDDSATVAVPDVAQLFTGSFRPANYEDEPDAFPPPAPKLSPANTLSAFAGTAPNGFWSLFVVDDFQLDSGTINNGWVLRLYWESNPVRLTAPRMLADGSFQMTVIGEAGTTHVIEASSDVRTWSPIATITLSGPEADFIDPNPASARFYRCTQP